MCAILSSIRAASMIMKSSKSEDTRVRARETLKLIATRCTNAFARQRAVEELDKYSRFVVSVNQ